MNGNVRRMRYVREGSLIDKKVNYKRSATVNNKYYEFAPKIAYQALISLLILVSLMLVRNVNTVYTNSIMNNVKTVMTQNVEIDVIWQKVQKVFEQIQALKSTNINQVLDLINKNIFRNTFELKGTYGSADAASTGGSIDYSRYWQDDIDESAKKDETVNTSYKPAEVGSVSNDTEKVMQITDSKIVSGDITNSLQKNSNAVSVQKNTSGASNASTKINTSNASNSSNVSTVSDTSNIKNIANGVSKTQKSTGTANNRVGASDDKVKSEKNESVLKAIGFIVPSKGFLGSPFGQRIHPIKNILEFHKGVDIAADMGSPIKSSMSGIVEVVGYEATYGNYVKISGVKGVSTLYAHCSQLLCKKGQSIKQGTVIAKVGNTGTSIGPHLHFEIRLNDKPVDPLKYICIEKK